MKRRLWLCGPAVLFCLLDATLTLAGQDADYWQGARTQVNEANPVGRVLLGWHELAFVAGILVWVAVVIGATLRLPAPFAALVALSVAVAHTVGAATWVLMWSMWPWSLVAAIGLLVAADSTIWFCWTRFRGQPYFKRRSTPAQTELQRLFAYDAWANREVAAALRKLDAPPERTVQLLAHIYAAQELWRSRMHGEPSKVAVWPALTLEQSEAALAEIAAHWRAYLAALTPGELGRRVTYTNSAGETFTSTVEDILRHVAMHGSYHRGQIATHLRLAGLPAAYTDYIHAARQGWIETR